MERDAEWEGWRGGDKGSIQRIHRVVLAFKTITSIEEAQQHTKKRLAAHRPSLLAAIGDG